MDILGVALKLLLAIGLGGLVGLEREASQKPAGLRTNTLICVSATMVMALSQIMLQGKAGTADALRIAAGVITGIGFIGAGTIIQARGHVHGLTTASTLWAVACLGLVIGAGYYILAAVFTAMILVTLIFLAKVETFYIKKYICHYHLKTALDPAVLANLKKLTLHLSIRMGNFNLKREKDHQLVAFTLACPETKEEQFQESLMALDGILEMKID
jgi:putative Mg2+ transporter-C (MgtC) family protein